VGDGRIVKVRVTQVNANPVLTLQGKMDFRSSPEVRKILRRWVKKKSAGFVVDLSGVERMDSSGVATLIECAREMEKYGGKLVLSGVGASVRDAFSLAGVGELFEVVNAPQEVPSVRGQG